MKPSITSLFFLCVIFQLLLSGCGITKMRYSRGFKSEFEFSFRKNQGQTERLTANKAIKKKGNPSVKETNESVSISTYSYTGEINIPPNKNQIETSTANQKPLKVFKKEKVSKPSETANNNKKSAPKEYRPIEPNSLAAGILFYGGIILSYAYGLGGILVLLGIIFAFVGLRKIKLSGGLYSGYAIDVSILVISLITLISILVFLVVLLALL